MNLEKLKILVESDPSPLRFDEANPIKALFNPSQLTIAKTANWRMLPAKERDTPATQFTHGNPAILSMELLFDTYEDGTDVRAYTNMVTDLTTVAKHGKFHRPPICQLTWGRTGVFFQGVLQNLNTRFTLFLADGTPVRATLACTFREWISSEEEDKRQNRQSVDVAKTRIVKRGETLSSIAADEFHDPTMWRPIAEANNIDDPRGVSPGTILNIPSLTNRGTLNS